jgi:putative Holliday junction resolvase
MGRKNFNPNGVGVNDMARIMAIDPGDVRIGLALSDPTETISRPLKVILHRSRRENAERILREAEEHEVEKIIVGVALDAEGEVGPQARKAMRLVHALRETSELPIETWDESGSSKFVSGKKRKNQPDDDLAAAHILQEYLDAEKSS